MNGELDLRALQRLSSGIEIRQDIRRSLRAVFCETGWEQWPYATQGGTAFIVNYRGKLYGITARHVLRKLDLHQVVVTDEKFGAKIAGVKAVYFPSDPTDDALDTDIVDMAVFEFSDDVGASFFNDTAYMLESGTAETSEAGDQIYVCGALREQSAIDGEKISMVFGSLDMRDDGPAAFDPTLRIAFAEFHKPSFTEVTGLSGSPVFNWTRKKLAGMLIRGTMAGNVCQGWYLDISDILEFLKAIHNGKTDTYYLKRVPVVGSEKT